MLFIGVLLFSAFAFSFGSIRCRLLLAAFILAALILAAFILEVTLSLLLVFAFILRRTADLNIFYGDRSFDDLFTQRFYCFTFFWFCRCFRLWLDCRCFCNCRSRFFSNRSLFLCLCRSFRFFFFFCGSQLLLSFLLCLHLCQLIIRNTILCRSYLTWQWFLYNRLIIRFAVSCRMQLTWKRSLRPFRFLSLFIPLCLCHRAAFFRIGMLRIKDSYDLLFLLWFFCFLALGFLRLLCFDLCDLFAAVFDLFSISSSCRHSLWFFLRNKVRHGYHFDLRLLWFFCFFLCRSFFLAEFFHDNVDQFFRAGAHVTFHVCSLLLKKLDQDFILYAKIFC